MASDAYAEAKRMVDEAADQGDLVELAKLSKAVIDVLAERRRQKGLAFAGDTDKFDETNTRNDWIAYIAAYTGRAAAKHFRNQREQCDFRENMVKAAALAVAAIEAHDNGWC